MSDNSATDTSLYGAVGTAVAALNAAFAAAAADGIWVDLRLLCQNGAPAAGVTPTTPVLTLSGGQKIVVYGQD